MTEELPHWDPSELRRILTLAGPSDAALILHHLRDDLQAAVSALEQAICDGNVEGMRRPLHALVALCGTAGATGLHGLACDLRDQVASGQVRPCAEMAEALRSGALVLARRLAQTVQH